MGLRAADTLYKAIDGLQFITVHIESDLYGKISLISIDASYVYLLYYYYHHVDMYGIYDLDLFAHLNIVHVRY